MIEIEIPSEALDSFDYRQMWSDLYEKMARRNLHDVVYAMDDMEMTEYEIYQESLELVG